jgi:hypothetical protein
VLNSNRSALEVVCPPPGIGAKKVHEKSLNSFGIPYIASTDCNIVLEGAAMDLHIATIRSGSGSISKNSSTLEVAFGPPGHGENSGNF